MKRVLAIDPDGNLETVTKVKAHRDHTDATLSEHERLLAFGSHSADEHADLAEKLHPTNSNEFKKQTEVIATAQNALAVIGEVIPL